MNARGEFWWGLADSLFTGIAFGFILGCAIAIAGALWGAR